MAHWTDGPEYAPTERPDVFVEPDAAPLDTPDPAPAQAAPTASAPEAAPQYARPDAPALEALVPARDPERDPREAFDVASTPLTTWAAPAPLPPPEVQPLPMPPPAALPPGAWGHAHAPQVNPAGFPQPGPPPWQPPPPQPELRSVPFGEILRGATPGVLIALLLGGIIHPFALALLILASVLATRIRYRRRLVGRLFSGAIMGSFLLGMAGLFGLTGSFDVIGWYDASTGWAQVACLVLLVVVPLVVGDAMRRGEEPEGYL